MSDELIDVKPPDGMRTVMLNNKPVGYVKETDDPNENARLAKEFLTSKGLWKEIPITKLMFDQAVSFCNVSNYIYEKDLKKIPREPKGITPFVVNAAFSAEMYLKSIQKKYGEPGKTHNLTTLFRALPNKVKDKLNKHKKRLETQHEVGSDILFKEHLKNLSNAFEIWRYIFEKDNEYIHIPTTIFVLHVLHQTAVEELEIET